jgi:hypothetical protein
MAVRYDKYRVIVPARQTTYIGGIDSLESISGLLKLLQIRAPYCKALYTSTCVRFPGILNSSRLGSMKEVIKCVVCTSVTYENTVS